MRKDFIFGIVVSIVVMAATSSEATTCTDWFRSCVTRAKVPTKCEGARKQCMRTGRWIGPETGSDYGPGEKK